MPGLYDLYSETYRALVTALARSEEAAARKVRRMKRQRDTAAAHIVAQAVSDALNHFPMRSETHLIRAMALMQDGGAEAGVATPDVRAG